MEASRRQQITIPSRSVAVVAVAALAGTFAVAGFVHDPAPAGADAAVTITPSSDLQGGQEIEVSVSGFAPSAPVAICQGVISGTPDQNDCGTPVSLRTADAGGSVVDVHRIERFIFVPSENAWYDCADPTVPCSIGAADIRNIEGTTVSVPLPLVVPAPPAVRGQIEVSPDLVTPGNNTATVTITGTGFRPNARMGVYQCLGVPDHPMDCGWSGSPSTKTYTPVDADSSGSFSTTFQANRFTLFTDCLKVPGCTFAAAEAVDFPGTVVSIPVNFPPPPLRVVPSGATVIEGDSGAQIVDIAVSLNQPSTDTVTVDWTTLQVSGAPDFQAEPDTDYTPASGVVTFDPGETNATVAVSVNGDPDVEHDEYFVVSFTNPTNAIMGGFWGLGFGVIENDDVFPSVVPRAGSVTEGDSGSQVLSVPVSLSEPWHETVTVEWATIDTLDQPEAGVDFEPAAGAVTFAPGETEAAVPVTVYGDTVPEDFLFGAEWGAVRFHSPINAILGRGFDKIGWALIVDDD